MTDEIFKARVGEFEGPLELLLQLIEERKLSINDVALARVTDDYLQFVERWPAERPASETMRLLTDFLVVASALILIKSRSLLPGLELSLDEEEQIADLERRLKLYQIVKAASAMISKRFGQNPIFWHERGTFEPVFTLSHDLTLSNLQTAVERVLAALPIKEKLPTVTVKKIMTLEEMIADLSARIQTSFKTSFKQLIGDKKDRVNIIIGFLAMLELVKRGLIAVEQGKHFDDISVVTRQTAVPRY